jgi:hypothetical protein
MISVFLFGIDHLPTKTSFFTAGKNEGLEEKLRKIEKYRDMFEY